MHTETPVLAYVVALAVVLRAAANLFAHALRRPGSEAVLRRDGRVMPR